MIRDYLDLHSVINVLDNGNFRTLPFEWVPKAVQYKSWNEGTSAWVYEKEKLTWEKRRIKKGHLLKVVADSTILPGWEVWCDVNDGASLEMNPIQATGLRLFSHDGGHVVVINFKVECNVYVRQKLDYFNEFYNNPFTASATIYSVAGSPSFNVNVDTGSKDMGVLSAYSGNVGNYYRTTATATCDGDMTKMDVIVSTHGVASEAIGFSGINICLGAYSPICPYTDNPVQYAHESAALMLWEEDTAPLGYMLQEDTDFLVQTLGDPLSVDFAPPPAIPILSWPIQDSLGSQFHNAHYADNPYLPAPIGWHSGDALHALRVRNGDLADRGVYTGTYGTTVDVSPGDAPAKIVRKASLLRMIDDGLVFGSHGTLGLADTMWYAPNSIQDLTWAEFMKSVRCAIFLPASPGRAWDDATMSMSFQDSWNQRHIHYMVPTAEDILPPFRSFQVYMKI